MNHTTSTNTQWGDRLPPWMIAAPLVVLAIMVALYVYGIPALARAAADRFPSGVAVRIDNDTLATLDRQVFSPSAIPQARQQAIASAFRALRKPAGPNSSYNLVFRKSDAIGANAMALPASTIIVTDGLVELARDDREILGVLAHEAGHLNGRTTLRGIIQISLTGVGLACLPADG